MLSYSHITNHINNKVNLMKPNPNKGRELYSEVNGKRYLRIPIQTHFIELGENLHEIIEKYAAQHLKENDVLCIATKIVSICTEGLTVHKDKVKISPLAKLITKFVKKWPNDIGYSNPRKMQVAINRAGYPRIIIALVVGTIMKLIGKPGYFYRIAGNQINAIDGFTVGYTSKPLFENYAFLPPRPKQAKEICNKIEEKFNVSVVMLDGNNVENNIMGMGDRADRRFEKNEFKDIVKGNPQGQEDDGNNTPLLIVREAE
ncbi:MAG: hypothetical protein Kow0081_1680 [Candidatus Dojkabacteria bacterium]